MMNTSFSGAVNAPPSVKQPVKQPVKQLVLTSDWDKTLVCDNGVNYELLEFLSDARKAGHRVIITSSMTMDKIEPALIVFIRSGRRRGYDIADMDQFEMICKADLKELKLKSDYSFDDESIGKQWIKDYVAADMEITVHKDFVMFPLSLAQLRERCGIPPRDGDAHKLSAATPTTPMPA